MRTLRTAHNFSCAGPIWFDVETYLMDFALCLPLSYDILNDKSFPQKNKRSSQTVLFEVEVFFFPKCMGGTCPTKGIEEMRNILILHSINIIFTRNPDTLTDLNTFQKIQILDLFVVSCAM